mgnify:FL=1
MKDYKKLLTVAIPTYNGGNNLIRAIKSCKNVDLPSDQFEILVVDNCSTDNSIDKVLDLMNEFENIRLHRNEKNIGRIGNWNRCLELAEGKYLLFLFANDNIYEWFSFRKIIEIALSGGYPSVMFNTLYHDGVNNRRFYNYKPGKWMLKDFIKKYFINNMASLGILQSHIFDLSLIKEKNIKFDEKIERTTDRIFIFDVINCKGFFYITDEIGTVWNLSKNRFHYSVHIAVENIKPEELYKYFYTNWIQEMIADLYILSNSGYGEEEAYSIFFTYVYKFYFIKYLRTLLSQKGKLSSIDSITLDIFIKYLETYGRIKGFPLKKIKFNSYLKILPYIMIRILNKLIQKK